MVQNPNIKIVTMVVQTLVKTRTKNQVMVDLGLEDSMQEMEFFSNKKAFLKMKQNSLDPLIKIQKKLQTCQMKLVKKKNQVTKQKLIKIKFFIKKLILLASHLKRIKEKKIKKCYQRNLHKTSMITMKINLKRQMKNYLTKKMKLMFRLIELLEFEEWVRVMV